MTAGKYVGDKKFYSDVGRLAIPSMLQQLLSSAMGMVDTMMVSAIGMVSPVGVASQLGHVCTCISFGVMEGTGIDKNKSDILKWVLQGFNKEFLKSGGDGSDYMESLTKYIEILREVL